MGKSVVDYFNVRSWPTCNDVEKASSVKSCQCTTIVPHDYRKTLKIDRMCWVKGKMRHYRNESI